MKGIYIVIAIIVVALMFLLFYRRTIPGYDGHPIKMGNYSSRLKREKHLNGKSDFYLDSKLLGLGLTCFFMYIDYTCLYAVWNTVQTDDASTIALISLGSAFMLDFPLAYAAYVLKKYTQGLAPASSAFIVMTLAVILFSIAFGLQFVFRYNTIDLTFSLGSASTLISNLQNNTAEGTNGATTNKAILSAGVFNAMIPLLTSLASFIFSFLPANPIGDRLHKLAISRIKTESHLCEIEQVIEENSDENDYRNEISEREAALRNRFCEEVKTQAFRRKLAVRLVLIERLSDEDEISAVILSAKKLVSSYTNYDPSLISSVNDLHNIMNSLSAPSVSP